MRFFALSALAAGVVALSCAQGEDQPQTSSSGQTEVDAATPTCTPGAKEICNGIDDNCDGRIDEGFDNDGDGYPTCAVNGKPADCDDNDKTVNPGSAEVCNGKDDNCDGQIDEGFDKDGDGYYECEHNGMAADCDDTDATVHPGAKEVCDGKDNDCNSKVDDIPATLSGSLLQPLPDAHWRPFGATVIANTGSVGWATLTETVNDPAKPSGALWWNASYVFDTFDMTATIWIENKPSGADGMAFVWMAGVNPSTVGYGPAYGAGGLPGYAVAIDTFQNPGETAVPALVIMNAANSTSLLRAAIPDIRDSQNHTLRVTLDAGLVNVFIDGTSYVPNFDLGKALAPASYTPITGQWGFTAGTGGSSEQHAVSGITMKFPNGQGCVP